MPRSVCRGSVDQPVLDLRRIHEREAGHISGTPAVHGSVANLAVGIAPLLEREVSHRQLIFSHAIGTFEYRHLSYRPWNNRKLNTAASTQALKGCLLNKKASAEGLRGFDGRGFYPGTATRRTRTSPFRSRRRHMLPIAVRHRISRERARLLW